MNKSTLQTTTCLFSKDKAALFFNYLLLSCLVFAFTSSPIQAQWIIDGQSTNEGFGSQTQMSDDGKIVAISGPRFNSFTGTVRVYQLVAGTWNQLGTDILGDTISDKFGSSLSLSADGTIFAASAPGNDSAGNNFGQVKVLQWQSGAWTQLGNSIYGTADHDGFGSSVSLSEDGLTMAVGARLDDAVLSNAGSVKIFDYVSGSWIQRGQTLNGTNIDDYFGGAISISDDGNRLAIGVSGSNGQTGHAEIYEWQASSWVQLGSDILGVGIGDRFGTSINLSGDGYTLVVGAPYNDNASGLSAGHARIFGWQSGSWLQIGNDLEGEFATDRNGISVQLSADGTQVAVGSPYNSSISYRCGQVRLFTLQSGSWIQNGPDINGVGAAFAGFSISLSSDFSHMTVNGSQGFGYVTIHKLEACEMSGVHAITRSSTNTVLLWDTEDDASRYRVRYKESGGSWNPVVLLGGHPKNFHVLSGLQANKTYIYRVRKDCYYGSTSGWSNDYTFSTYTSDPCSKPDAYGYAYHPNANPSRVRLYCSYEPDAVNGLYLVRWRESTSSAWQRKVIGKTNHLLTNLSAGTEYVYQFRTKCASGWSHYTSIDTFVTLPASAPFAPAAPNRGILEKEGFSSVEVYPNPAQNYLFIELPTDVDLLDLYIFDMQGRLVSQNFGKNWENGLDISTLKNGLYFLKIHTEFGQVLSTRFLKVE